MMTATKVLDLLPYSEPFLFVDSLHAISEHGVEGAYTFKPTSSFYQGHFKNVPVTPGVILTECCAQIGVVCLGIYLMDNLSSDSEHQPQIALSSSEMEFFLPVFPGETVKVVSEKEYFRFNKLKCKVRLYRDDGALACKGFIAGMLKLGNHGQ